MADAGQSGTGEGENGSETQNGSDTEMPEGQAGEEVVRPKVKGIFVTGPMAGTDNMEHLIELVDDTELNAIVMDIKNDEGRVVYDMQIPAVSESGAGIRYVQDMESLLAECKEKDIYLIARIVAFKDPFLAEVKPEWCIHNKDGSIFKDKGGLAWLNPYNREVWEYLLDIAEEALRMGFDEIQFDYIRFSTDDGMKDVDFGQTVTEGDRQQVIIDFVKYASERVHKAGGVISADVYGMVIDSEVDQKIVGQDYVEMSKHLDYISPMVYPSHYGPYNYNIPVPDAEPYRLVLTALLSSKKVLAGIPVNTVSGNLIAGDGTSRDRETGNSISGNTLAKNGEPEFWAEEIASLEPMSDIRAKVRPWLQDFTASWVAGHIPYGKKEIRDQIQAVYDAGYEEWILWNASNKYTEDGLLKEE
ncbi:MAG: putative glycoside hydrolase [Lachnospiraceae bacterium]|nr:putative glycoside hydrolase [Lachnospiraceae bacterium]